MPLKPRHHRPPRARAPDGLELARLPATASVIPATSNGSVMVRPSLAPAMAIGGQRSDSPWLRAAMLTPSVTNL